LSAESNSDREQGFQYLAGTFGITGLNHQTNSACALKMGPHPTTIILENKGRNSFVTSSFIPKKSAAHQPDASLLGCG
jgi:hypothetical protein